MTRISNLNNLLNSEDTNGSIIELDNFISELCDYGDDFSKLTEEQKLFYLNQNLEREINNGGFNQFFSNSAGDNSHETIVSLKAVGAYKTADILQKAIDQFPGSKVPKDMDERTEILEQIEVAADGVWSELDEQFYEYEDDLNTLNLAYVKEHKDFF